MSASSPPAITTFRRLVKQGELPQRSVASASTPSPSASPRCASAPKTSPCSPTPCSKISATASAAPATLSTPCAVAALQRYHWPGNVRELRNVLERAILLGGGAEIRSADLFFDRTAEIHPAATISTALTLEQMERSYIQQVLQDVKGKVDIAAACAWKSRAARSTRKSNASACKAAAPKYRRATPPPPPRRGPSPVSPRPARPRWRDERSPASPAA